MWTFFVQVSELGTRSPSVVYGAVADSWCWMRFPLNASMGSWIGSCLPEPVFEKAVFRAPVTAVEEIVASVFAEAVGCGSCGSR